MGKTEKPQRFVPPGRAARLAKIDAQWDLFEPYLHLLSEGTRLEVKQLFEERKARTGGRKFVQMALGEKFAVRAIVRKHSDRPAVIMDVLDALCFYVAKSSQEVIATRKQLAEIAETSVENVSRALTLLESLNVVWREDGEGRTKRVFLNPRVGSKQGWEAAEMAADEAPVIRDPDAPPLRGFKPRLVVP